MPQRHPSWSRPSRSPAARAWPWCVGSSDLLNPKYKGRVGIPTYGWVGNSWLQVLNKTHGGDEDNVDPGIKFLAELVKKNEAVIIENTDATMKGFTRKEIVIM